jgi:transposase-like protein
MSMRAVPFYCPYCAEQELEPIGDEAGSYYCSSCDRRFTVKFLGLGESDASVSS